jgi:hypothetical protein
VPEPDNKNQDVSYTRVSTHETLCLQGKMPISPIEIFSAKQKKREAMLRAMLQKSYVY